MAHLDPVRPERSDDSVAFVLSRFRRRFLDDFVFFAFSCCRGCFSKKGAIWQPPMLRF